MCDILQSKMATTWLPDPFEPAAFLRDEWHGLWVERNGVRGIVGFFEVRLILIVILQDHVPEVEGIPALVPEDQMRRKATAIGERDPVWPVNQECLADQQAPIDCIGMRLAMVPQ